MKYEDYLEYKYGHITDVGYGFFHVLEILGLKEREPYGYCIRMMARLMQT